MARWLTVTVVLGTGAVFAAGCGGDDPRSAPADAAPLIAAARAGEADRVRTLLDRGAPIDARAPDGATALLGAIGAGHDAVALLLIDRGADINAQADNRDTPWLLAGAEGRAAVLRAMIPMGPDLTLRNRFGGNALIPACERGHVDAVRVLLTTRIDVDHVNNLGWTCILEAVILGDGGAAHEEVVRQVLAAGANPAIPDRDGVTALTHAERRGFRELASLLRAAR